MFTSTDASLPNVAVLDNKIFINARIIGAQTTDLILEQVSARVHTYEIVKVLPDNILTLLKETVAKMGIDNVSEEMQLQNIAFLMLFTQDTTLTSNMFMLNKDAMSTIKTYLDTQYNKAVLTAEKEQ